MQDATRFRESWTRAQMGLLRRSEHIKRMQFFTLWLCIMLVPISIAMAAGAPATAPTTKAAVPKSNAAAPPPTTTKATTPPIATTAPKASPPVLAAAPPPKATAVAPTLPPAAAPPPTKLTSPPPKPAANLTSPPPATPPKSAPPPATPPPKSPPISLTPAPAPALAPAASPVDLDISQVAALHQLKVSFDTAHPCKTSDDILLCDTSGPPHHLTSLSLRDCPKTANFSTAALFNLSTLQSLELVNCSVKPVHIPNALVASLKTFICSASLGRTGTNEKADKLSGLWLSKMTNLEELSVTDVELSVSALDKIVTPMKGLTQLMVSRTNLAGTLPRKTWPDSLVYIDVSANSIRGTVPSQMQSLTGLKHLDLSDNQIKGVLPNIFDDLQQLQYIDLSGNQFSGRIPGSLAYLRNCSHLDLSNNKLNGSIPANLTLIRTLKYLDLSQNELTGPIPFNSTFLNKLTTLKLGQNSGLCYNHTALKSKFLTGIRNCVSVADDTIFAPAPAPASSDLSASSGKSGHISKGAAAGISIVVIVAAAAVVFVARKWWKAREEVDQFENLRAQKDRP